MLNAALFPIIVGPTAGGKSALAVEVALALGGAERAEIVTADAYQVYRGLDIGTAKPTAAERRGIVHHLIDIVDPGERFTVHDWLRAAEGAITDIRARRKMPIVVGGTHLYVKSFLDGMFEGPGASEEIRAELRLLPQAALRAELDRVDAAAAAKLHSNDLRRTIRALEVFRLTGVPISEHQRQWDREDHARKDCVLVGLDWPAELLNPRINARVKEMIARGLVDEARGLWERGAFALKPVPEGRVGVGSASRPNDPSRAKENQTLDPKAATTSPDTRESDDEHTHPNPSLREGLRNQAAEALGYKQLIAHFKGRCSLDDAIEEIKIETRRFAKNQRTWLKRLRTTRGSVWIEVGSAPSDSWTAVVMRALGGES